MAWDLEDAVWAKEGSRAHLAASAPARSGSPSAAVAGEEPEQVLSTNVNSVIVYTVGLERVSWVIWGIALQ